MVEPVKSKCSFCPRKACRVVSDEGGFYDCCATCERAWRTEPSFLGETPVARAALGEKP